MSSMVVGSLLSNMQIIIHGAAFRYDEEARRTIYVANHPPWPSLSDLQIIIHGAAFRSYANHHPWPQWKEKDDANDRGQRRTPTPTT
ncbi:uncharacterized protein G2W53_035339 [Senna tora]|uniref:Uncharacterized protein n=1 Tax=Senna tora TaxID=362788 RepID=A0A834W7H4_9FABA|nr:uncharacterized protein G2W53_035339 [Senna tora]